MQREGPPTQESEAAPSWAERLAKTKVTPLVFLAFFALPAAMSGLAALVGYTVHLLARPGVHDVRP